MNRSLLLLALCAACAPTQAKWPEVALTNRCEANAFPEGPLVVSVMVGTTKRQALAWVPRAAGPKDVVVNLHEFRSAPQRQAAYSGWVQFHDEANVILLAPDGKSSTWNAGDCCGAAAERGIDDVAFLDALVRHVEAIGCTSGRVLATGIGNGGMMAERWACESDVPDAIVSVGGSLQREQCSRTKPLPVLHYHGDADKFVPVDGSRGVLEGGLPGGVTRPLAAALSTWTTLDQAAPRTSQTAGALTCATWQGAAPVVDCRIAGGADTWPGSENGPVSSTSPLADATRGAWAWVQQAWTPAPTAATPAP